MNLALKNPHTILNTIPAMLAGIVSVIVKFACATTSEITDISTNNGCLRGGMSVVYYAKYDEIDWTATLATYDEPTNILSAFTMVATKTFKTLSFAKKSGKYNFTYTKDSGVYENLITMIFEGKAAITGRSFCGLVATCGLVLVIIDNNCQGRVTGVEFNGTTFEEPIVGMAVDRHDDASGEFGTDKPRDEVDFKGESLCPPIFHDMSKADMATYL
jgi:hypothetical protein